VKRLIQPLTFGVLAASLYELLTGTSLFCVAKFGREEEESPDNDYLLQLNDTLEPLPDIWLKEKWPQANKYFGSCRERLDPNARKDLGEDLDDRKDLVGFDGTDGDSVGEQVEC